jgi:hypothetical protein
MPDVRVCVALHFTFDPAKSLATIPTEITKTVSIGDVVMPEKVTDKVFGESTKKLLVTEMEKLVFVAQKKAKPAPKKAPESKVAEETGAQGSLL